jgi:hypothetical protein
MLNLLALCSISMAKFPQIIHYQGRLLDAGFTLAANTAYFVKFMIYNDPGILVPVNIKWNPGFQIINTVDELFEYNLGSKVTLPIILAVSFMFLAVKGEVL